MKPTVISKNIYIKQVEILFSQLPVAIAGNLVVAAIVAFTHVNVIYPLISWIWLGLLLLLSLYGIAVFASYKRHFDHTYEKALHYERHFYPTVVLCSLFWGSACFILLHGNHLYFLHFVIVVICAGAITTLRTHLKHVITFIVLLFIPTIIYVLTSDIPVALGEAALGLVFVVLMINISMLLNRATKSMLLANDQLAEEARNAQKQQNILRLVLENIPTRVFWKGKDLHYLGANSLFQEDAGLSANESIVGKSDEELIWKDRHEEFTRVEKEVLATGKPKLHYEEFSLRKDGSPRWIEVSKVPILNETGEIEGVLGSYYDITSRKQAENMIRMVATAFETQEAISITDAGGNILSVNRAFTEVTGYSKEEVIGKKPSILSSGKHDVSFYEGMWLSLIRTGRWKGEVINRRKNGQNFTELLSITAVKDEGGETVNYVAVFSDISEKIELEQQLRQAQKMEAIGTLVSGIAHEFNNMLTGISGNVFLAKGLTNDIEMNNMLTIADDLCFKAADMVKQLLTFSRKGNSTQNLRQLNMADWLPQALKLCRSSIEKKVNLICEIPPHSDLPFNGDTTQLQQILMNLLNNAKDASMDRNTPEIHIKVTEGNADKSFRLRHPGFTAYEFIRLTVSDNGTGIAEDKLGKIFEPFYTTKDIGKGTGLGMPVIQGLVEAHQGCIEVASTLGQGTSFVTIQPSEQSKRLQRLHRQ